MIAQDLGLVTAYAYAVSQGYTGTEEEFAELMASYATVAERAEAAATAAETAQGKAEDAQTAAESAQTAAETAQGKAEDAQTGAETAETNAETAQGKAETAQGKAEDAQTAAETAQGKAEDAQTAAEGAQTAAESAQGYAEGYATAASGSASASSTQALKSEGYAVGTQDGTPVASGSPYYEYNSKYFADEAAAVAASIPEDYSELSDDVADLKSALTHDESVINGDVYNPYSWEAGTYQSISVNATLTKSDSATYIDKRKRFVNVTSVSFGSKISMKTGYKINLLTVDGQNKITETTGYVDSATLETGKRYGAVLKASNDGDISATAIDTMLEVSVADSQIEKNRVNINSISGVIQKIADNLSEWTPVDVLSGYAINADNGNLISGTNYRYTDYVSADTNTRFKVSCRAYSSVCGGYSYDANKNPLRKYMTAGSTGINYVDEIITPLADEKYFRFSTVNVNTMPLSVLKYDLEKNPLYGKTLMNFGDSIAAGNGNKGTAYAKYIAWANGMTLYDYALGGATLTTFTANNNVQNQLETAISEHSSDSVDYILFEGGTNDLTNNTPVIGELVSGYDVTTNPRDITTIIGAAENIIGKIRNTWPNAKIIYVSVHKMPTRNLANQQSIHDALLTVCDKWSIQMADIFGKGGINSFITAMLPGNFPAHPDDPSYPTGYDRTHPAENGYKRFYVPFITGMFKNM